MHKDAIYCEGSIARYLFHILSFTLQPFAEQNAHRTLCLNSFAGIPSLSMVGPLAIDLERLLQCNHLITYFH